MNHWSLRTRLVAVIVAAVVLLVGIQTAVHMSRTSRAMREEVVDRARSVLLTAEAARSEMTRKWHDGLFTQEQLAAWSREGDLERILETVPIIAAWRTASAASGKDGYRVKAPHEHPRNPRNAPDALDRQALRRLREGAEEVVLYDDEDNLRYYRPVKVTRECLLCHGDPASSRELWGNDRGLDATGAPMEGWRVGEIRAALEVIQSLEPEKQAVAAIMRDGMIFTLVVMLLCIGAVVLFVNRNVARPLLQAVGRLRNSSDDVLRSTAEVASSGQDMAERASRQAAGLQEVTAELQQIAGQARDNDGRAEGARGAVQEAMEVLAEGRRAVDEMSGAMEEIKAASDRTGGIIKTIDELAFQTNLLALNAAVEAARAGEAGKGFAVVAEEVRKLAASSAAAARDSAALLEQVRERTDNGVAVAVLVREALARIDGVMERIDELVQGVATASREQRVGIDQISNSLGEIDGLTQGNAATAQEIAAAAEMLARRAGELQDIVRDLEEIMAHREGREDRTSVGGEKAAGKAEAESGNDAPAAAAGVAPPAATSRRAPAPPPPESGLPPGAGDREVFHLDEEDLIEI